MLSPLYVFLFSSVASGIAGITAYLKANKEPEWIAGITAFLNSSMLGLAISCLWLRNFKDNPFMLIGLCIMIGLGGASGQALIMGVISKSGLTINFDPKKDDNDKV